MLRAGLVDFTEPTLLLLGDARSFDELSQQIEGRQSVVIECEPGKDVARLVIVPSTQGGIMSRIGEMLEWQLSVSEATVLSAQLHVLATSPTPGHQYLDPTNNLANVQVVASMGEYDPAGIFAE